MCAILFTNDEEILKYNFEKALALMNHRGPDKSSTLKVKNFTLGHNRLKIIDLDNAANQPFVCSENRYIIIFNGEIYNFKELKTKYNLTTITKSDTEVLLELYKLKKEKLLNELNGMFSFIILDKKTNNFFVARDRLGIKPLYYTMYGNNNIIFSSEISPILKLINTNEFDEVGLRQYLKLRTFFNGHTIYKNIHMMKPGTYYKNDSFHTYWEFPNTIQEAPEDEELYELLKSSVRYRCIADVPIGSFLSGGIDSSIISGLSKKVDTWTVGYKDNNEFNWSEITAKHQKVSHYKTILKYDNFLESLDYLIEKRKEPISVPNEVLLFEMSKNVKTKNTVVLSGEGADELMFGYDRIFKWAQNNPWNLSEFDKLYSYGSHEDNEIIDYVVEPYKKYSSNINMIAAFFQVSHLHGLLQRLDYTTMLNSVEARVPFLDYRLVERMAGVPFEYRMKNGIVKAPLKRVFKNLLPKEIIEREKVGFPVNLNKVFEKNQMDLWLEYNINQLKGVIK